MSNPSGSGHVDEESKPTPGTDPDLAVNNEQIPDPSDLQEGKDREDRPTASGATEAGHPDRGYSGKG